jgi:rhodanese-related sulfurtransferase
MKNRIVPLCIICMISTNISKAQFKYDDKSYRTIYLQDLCRELQSTGKTLLLDVRSPCEFSDTSSRENLNIGRLKGAKNISIQELGARLNEISEYKNQKVILYCSHSQRSRVGSKLLSDSGFTNVLNLNGGMTEFHMLDQPDPCLRDLFETGNKFTLLSPEETFQLIKKEKNLYILDVRPDSAFKGIAGEAISNSYGRIKNSVNIPFSQLLNNLSKVPHEKSILLVDDGGAEAHKAAILLAQNGFSRIHVLFNGLDNWISGDEKDLNKMELVWEHPKDFGLLSSEDLHKRMLSHKTGLILDIRSRDEFANQEKNQPWKNKGHIKDAVNIPLDELPARINEIETSKSKEVIVYAFSGNPEAFEAAKILTGKGFNNVKVLTGGLWDLRWRAANVKGMKSIMQWVVDVPEENL